LIDLALTQLKELAAVRSTMERESLIGSAYKRLAMVHAAAGQERQARRDLAAMLRAYEKALRVGKMESGANLYYPASNCLAAAVAVGAGELKSVTLDPDILAIVDGDLAKKNAGHKADFWSAVGAIEVRQYRHMAARTLGGKGTLEDLETRYRDLRRRVASARKWASVYDNACLVLGRYADPHSSVPPKERKAAQALLDIIRILAHPDDA
jgi:hypothetical protein